MPKVQHALHVNRINRAVVLLFEIARNESTLHLVGEEVFRTKFLRLLRKTKHDMNH